MTYILLIIIAAIVTWSLKPNQTDAQCDECKQELENRKEQLKTIVSILEEKENEHKIKQSQIESLKAEIRNYESDLDVIECGFYDEVFDFDDEESFKEEIKIIKADQKWEVKHNNVIRCDKDWRLGGSEARGRKLVTQYSKIMLKCLNSECDTLISKVRFGNITSFTERIKKSYKAINKFGELYSVSIDRNYLQLKLRELSCTYEHERLKEKKKEEAKEIRERMKQEQAEVKALEAEKKKAESEADKVLKDLQNASKLLEKDKLNDKLIEKIEKLKIELENKGENVRKISQAMITKAGTVYFIRNKSFDDGIVKIGLTRRLTWTDRVDELSNASTIFKFDIHGCVFSDDAPALEAKLHKIFDEKRVNVLNRRKEYFNVSLDEIEIELKKLGYDVDLIRDPKNVAWEQSQAN